MERVKIFKGSENSVTFKTNGSKVCRHFTLDIQKDEEETLQFSIDCFGENKITFHFKCSDFMDFETGIYPAFFMIDDCLRQTIDIEICREKFNLTHEKNNNQCVE